MGCLWSNLLVGTNCLVIFWIFSSVNANRCWWTSATTWKKTCTQKPMLPTCRGKRLLWKWWADGCLAHRYPVDVKTSTRTAILLWLEQSLFNNQCHLFFLNAGSLFGKVFLSATYNMRPQNSNKSNRTGTTELEQWMKINRKLRRGSYFPPLCL